MVLEPSPMLQERVSRLLAGTAHFRTVQNVYGHLVKRGTSFQIVSSVHCEPKH